MEDSDRKNHGNRAMTIEEIRKLLAAITPVWERADICVGGGGEVRPVVEFITKAPETVAFLLGELEKPCACCGGEGGCMERGCRCRKAE